MKSQLKKRAFVLRKRGSSLEEISGLLSISKSTASVWLKDVIIRKDGLDRLEKRKIKGRKKAVESNIKKRKEVDKEIKKGVSLLLEKQKCNTGTFRLFCAILYWCEGNKDDGSVRFTNSDPKMVKCFLLFLRKSFKISEDKFRVCLHLHSYHNEIKQKDYWNKVTNIDKKYFIKSYQKINTGKRKRKNYPGCASIRYHDAKIAKELNVLWQLFSKKYGRVG